MTKSLDTFSQRPMPGDQVLEGPRVRIERLHDRHIDGLFTAVAGPQNDPIWRYMPNGPYHTRADFEADLNHMNTASGWRTMVFLCQQTDQILGMGNFQRIRPDHGSCEIGTVAHAPALQRTPAATEVHYLLAKHLFEDLGYRRYEWKCNALNAASMKAAKRYGFTYEGTFRQDMVVKGKNRDTAWWSMLDGEWPRLKRRFEAWLDPANFGDDGTQRQRLEECG